MGIKSGGKIRGKYNHGDSYYSSLGEEAVEAYFKCLDIMDLAGAEEWQDEEENGNIFLYDGLYCEFGYVHNLDNDTLEIYRGFFKFPQIFDELYEGYDGTKYYEHLVIVIDRKLHTKKMVLAAMKAFDDYEEDDKGNEGVLYPERAIINLCDGCFKPIEVGKRFHNKDCESQVLLRKI